jgi:hypothetical protein
MRGHDSIEREWRNDGRMRGASETRSSVPLSVRDRPHRVATACHRDSRTARGPQWVTRDAESHGMA